MTVRDVVLGIALSATAASAAFAAGDVAASVDAAGTLVLTGGDASEDVQVARDSATRELVVTGRNGTTVNGAAAFRAAGVRSLRIDAGAGDDVVAVGGFRLPGGVSASLGDGHDTLTFLRAVVRGKVEIRGGVGDDDVRLEGGCDLVRGGSILTEDGNDRVRIADSVVRGRMQILTGAGDDRVEIHRNGFTEPASLVVRTGEGADVADLAANTLQGPVRVLTEDGNDAVGIATSRFRSKATISTGGDDDDVDVERTTFDAKFLVTGGAGTNSVYFVGIHITGGGSGATIGARGHSGNVYWAFVIVHVFP